MNAQYQFLDFTLNTQQQSLYKGEDRIEITSTVYKLLTFFLEHPNVTVSRHDLTDHVWPNRIVTETSLDKLIQRLRKVLGDTDHHKKIIRTIHGEGFVFLPTIETNNQQEEPTNQVKNQSSKFKTALFAVLLSVLVIYFLTKDADNSNDLTIISQAQSNPMIVSLIPDITGNNDSSQTWMVKGGMHYLSDKFNDSIGHDIKNISLQTLAENDPEKFAIDLSQKEATHSSVIVSIKQTNDQYNAEVKIRSANGVIDQKSFNSLSIKAIYDDIAFWAQTTLNIEFSPDDETVDSTISKNSYAVENYIRAISAELSGDAKQAINYLELATNEDPKFWAAWLKLSINYRKQGQYEKAMSIVKVFEQAKVTDQFKIMVINSKVNIHNAMGEFDQALDEVDSAINLARKNNNIKSQYILLSNKAYTASQLGKFKVAIDSINESIRLIKQENENNHARLGSTYSTLSGIENNMQNFKDAETHAKLAIKHLTLADNKRYVAKVKLRLSNILSNTGKLNEAENLVSDAIITLSQLDAALEESTAYMRLIDFQLLRGDFEAAQTNYNRLTESMADISSKDQANYYLIVKSDVMLAVNNHEEAKDTIDKLGASYISDYHHMQYYRLALRYYELIGDIDNWQQTAREFIQLNKFNENPLTYLTEAKLAIQEGKNELAQDAFEQAKAKALKTHSPKILADVLNPYILFLLELQSDINQAEQNLFELEKYAVPLYPYLKVKAQILFKQGKIFQAATVLEHLKSKVGRLWNADDQLLLENYRSHITSGL